MSDSDPGVVWDDDPRGMVTPRFAHGAGTTTQFGDVPVDSTDSGVPESHGCLLFSFQCSCVGVNRGGWVSDSHEGSDVDSARDTCALLGSGLHLKLSGSSQDSGHRGAKGGLGDVQKFCRPRFGRNRVV